uniref:Zinc finger, CCHC-type, retrotransposon Gag domain protein n=1 Tax=Tanacetum cinerariifolium TaxID=118510 RepID=A0A699RZR7_TANCI|nr:zinc finger, CCHC-type, retrotransposon Gag domain protein [Tanacetum cinerariifolium]
MEKLFQVLGCPDNFKTRLAAFKLEADGLSWWKAHLRTQEIKGRYDQGQHVYRGRQDHSVEYKGRQDRGQKRSTETLPPPPLCATCGKPHLGVCYKATRGCFTCGST